VWVCVGLYMVDWIDIILHVWMCSFDYCET
jgi:hypothetical protein